jgi:hypothetical protein
MSSFDSVFCVSSIGRFCEIPAPRALFGVCRRFRPWSGGHARPATRGKLGERAEVGDRAPVGRAARVMGPPRGRRSAQRPPSGRSAETGADEGGRRRHGCACYTPNRPRAERRWVPETTSPRRPRCPRKACRSPRETNRHLRSIRSRGSDGGSVYPGPRPVGRGLFSFPGFQRGRPPGRAPEGELDARHCDRRPAMGRRGQG